MDPFNCVEQSRTLGKGSQWMNWKGWVGGEKDAKCWKANRMDGEHALIQMPSRFGDWSPLSCSLHVHFGCICCPGKPCPRPKRILGCWQEKLPFEGFLGIEWSIKHHFASRFWSKNLGNSGRIDFGVASCCLSVGLRHWEFELMVQLTLTTFTYSSVL